MDHQQYLRRVYHLFRGKHSSELAYWKKCYHQEKGTFSNSHYPKLLLAMAGEPDQAFLSGKVVADFGCGPRGTLNWITNAKVLYGIDLLIPEYLKHFSSCMKTHGMVYVACTEKCIPMPDNSVDILFTLNAMDHVKDFPQMCGELHRILKPGGILIGSFNLNQAPTAAEPQCLTITLLEKYLLKGFHKNHTILSAIPKSGYLYQPLIDNTPIPVIDEPAILWVRAEKKRDL